MPILDFVCSSCSAVLRNEFFMGDQPRTRTCACGSPMEILWAGRGPSVGFAIPIEFDDDDGTHYSFTSPEEVHRFEKRTEDEVAAGLRPRPFVFREMSQSLSSHRDVNVFQQDHPQVKREALLRERRGKRIISIGKVDVSVHGDPNSPSGEPGGEA